ncbi:MAG: hypothetical protein ACLSIL_19630 [Enterococcus casseliflavus]
MCARCLDRLEGRTVKEIAVTFQPEFTTKAGLPKPSVASGFFIGS